MTSRRRQRASGSPPPLRHCQWWQRRGVERERAAGAVVECGLQGLFKWYCGRAGLYWLRPAPPVVTASAPVDSHHEGALPRARRGRVSICVCVYVVACVCGCGAYGLRCALPPARTPLTSPPLALQPAWLPASPHCLQVKATRLRHRSFLRRRLDVGARWAHSSIHSQNDY